VEYKFCVIYSVKTRLKKARLFINEQCVGTPLTITNVYCSNSLPPDFY